MSVQWTVYFIGRIEIQHVNEFFFSLQTTAFCLQNRNFYTSSGFVC
jgi:hypothetical protein